MFKEKEKEEILREKVSFSELDKFIKEKLKEIKIKEQEAISIIKEKIIIFSKEINENIKALNEVDIELKEKNEKIKSTVYEGRKKYVEFLERFIKSMREMADTPTEKTDIEKVIGNVNSAFVKFNESSGKSYERATILIGKEMGRIRESIKIFSNELITLFNPGRDMILTSKKFQSIESIINDVNNAEENIKKLDKDLEEIEQKIKQKVNDKEGIDNRIESIKKSQEYLENKNREKNIQDKEKEIEKLISELRIMINFKSLSNFFHIFEDKMSIVKSYRDDFLEEFNRDEGERILNLLNESKLNTKNKEDKIKQIKEIKDYIKTEKMKIKKDETLGLSSEAEKISDEIKDMKKEKEWKENNREKLKNNQEQSLKSIKNKLDQLNISLED